MLNEARKIISKAKGNKCVLFSGGADSLIVLKLCLEQFPDIDVVSFAADWTKENFDKLPALSAEMDFTLYTFPPSHRYLVPGANDDICLIDEYLGHLPVIRDIEAGENCVFDLSPERYEGLWLGWDCVFTGTKSTDEHFVTGKALLGYAAVVNTEIMKFIQPLHNFSDTDIKNALNELELTDKVIEGTGEISACTACLHGRETFCPAENKIIPPLAWNGDEMLKAYQEKYGVN